jgi:hypothetical protein
MLIATVESTPNPWQEAQGRRVLAEVYFCWGDRDRAMSYLDRTREIATRYGYKELLFVVDDALDRHSKTRRTGDASTPAADRTARPVLLTQESQTVIDQLSCLSAR